MVRIGGRITGNSETALRDPIRKSPSNTHCRLFSFAETAPEASYFFFPAFTGTVFAGTTIGRRIGTSPAPGSCCCIRDSISVRT
jgi:hypothetical protein